MNQNVAHADDITPRHLGVLCPELVRQGAHGLSDNPKIVKHPDLNQLVLLGPGTDAPGPAQRIVRWWPAENRLEEVNLPALKGIERAEAMALDADGRLLLVTDYRVPTPRQVFHRLQIEKP